MPKLRRIIESPPEPKGDAEQQIAALREYIALVNEELEYLLTHIELDNTNFSFTDDIKEQMPKPYTGRPEMDGIASPGTSDKWSRGNHKHGTDITRAAAADLSAHVGDTANPHGVTKDQVGLGNVANERQYSADNPPPLPTPGGIGAIPTTEKGAAGGVAELDANGMVPSAQLPSYVDDVLEYASLSAFPATGETGKIYVALDTNRTYRWSGSAYVEISESLALGETSSTAYRGDRGKTAYDHSQVVSGNPHNVTAAEVGARPDDWVPDAGDIGYTNPDLSATNVEDALNEIVAGGGGGGGPSPATATPVMDGTGAVGSSLLYAREDHEHPSDTSKQDSITASGILKGDGLGGVSAAAAGTDYQAPLTAGTDYQTPLVAGTDYQTPLVAGTDYQTPLVAGTDYQTPLTAGTDYQTPLTAGTDYATPGMIPTVPSAYTSNPAMDGTASPGSSGAWAKGDHVHPSDTSKANLEQIGYPETGTTASRNYSAGEYICWNGLTYTADTNIATGTTLSASGGNKNLTECVGGGFNDLRADYYDSGILPGSSNWVDTAITESDLRKWHFVVLCTSIVVSGGTRNVTSATIPVGAVLTGQIFEAPYSFDNTLTAVMRFNTSARALQYNTGNGAWSCRIILCK